MEIKVSWLLIGCFLNPKVLIFFLFLHENIYCGYSLEAPWHKICFPGERRKNINLIIEISRPMRNGSGEVTIKNCFCLPSVKVSDLKGIFEYFSKT